MDQAGQQLLHEQQMASSPSPSSTESSPTITAARSPTMPTPVPSQQPVVQNTPHNPMEALQSSLLSGKFSDLAISHGVRRWKAHKVVVCSQSSVLDSKIQVLENGNTSLDLAEYDYDSICRMMEYFYTSAYTTPDQAPEFGLSEHIKVFSLAVDLACPGLEAVAASNFRETLSNKVADLETYFTSIESIYASTTPEHPALRTIVVEAAIIELRQLLEGPVRTRFLRLASDVPGFHADVMLTLFHNPSRPVEKFAQELCEECGPRDEGDGYEVTTECKSCGMERTLEFY